MTTRSAGRGLAKAGLVLLAAAAGAATGFSIGLAYVLILLPNAGLEGILPPALGAMVGAAVGCFVELAVLFKVPRLQRDEITWVTWTAVVSLILGAGGFAVLRAGETEASWAALLQVLLPLGLLVGIVGASSLAFGRSRGAETPR